MADSDSLLDVFVRVLPQEGDLEAIQAHLQNTISETTRAFNQLGDQANALARRQDFIRNQGRSGSGPRQRTPEEESARRAQDEFRSLRAQVGNDIGTLQKQLSSLRAGGLLTDLQGVREAFKEVSRLQINLSDGNAEVQIEERIDQLLDLRRVLETIQERAADGGGTSTPIEGNLIAAQKQARNLKFEMAIVRRGLKDLRAPQLKESLEESAVELDRLILQMREMDDTGLTAGAIEPYLAQLRNIRAAVHSIGDAQQEVSQIQEKATERLEAAEQERLRLQDRIKDFPPGVLSKDDRLTIQGINNDLSRTIRELDVARDKINGTALSWKGYEEALHKVIANQNRLTTQFDTVRAAGASFNTLSNNAYQLGQAFEDAAIGYELNGIAGAVRGASNNVSFLLNDLSRIPAIQTRVGSLFKLSEKAAEAVIPAASGIGAALAITVLPPMIEWLETLNDIDYGFTNLARRLQQEFEDIDLEIDITLDEKGLNRELRNLNSVKEVLEEIRSLAESTDDLTDRLQEQVADLGRGDDMRRFVSDLDTVSERITEKLKDIRRQARRDLTLQEMQYFGGNLDTGVIPVLPGEISESAITAEMQELTSGGAGELSAILTYIKSFNRDLDVLQENARQGIFDVEGLRSTRDLLERLTERFEAAKKTLDPKDEDFVSAIDETLKTVQKRIDSLIKPARELESLLNEQVSSAIESIGQKTEELAAKQAILRGQLIGTSTEYDEMVLGVSEVSREYQSLIASTIEFYERSGAARDRIEELRRNLEDEAAFEVGNQLLREQNDIVDKLAKAEQRLADLRDKEKGRDSRRVSLDQFATAIQETALSLNETGLDKNTTAIQDLTEEVGRLQDALFKINQAQEAIGQDNTADVIRGIALQRTPRQMAPGVLAGAFGGIGGGVVAGLQQAQDLFAAVQTARLGAANSRVALQQKDIEEIGNQFADRIRRVLKDQPIRIDKTWQPEIQAPPARLAN